MTSGMRIGSVTQWHNEGMTTNIVVYHHGTILAVQSITTRVVYIQSQAIIRKPESESSMRTMHISEIYQFQNQYEQYNYDNVWH